MKTFSLIWCTVLVAGVLTWVALALDTDESQCIAECALYGESQVCFCEDIVELQAPLVSGGKGKRNGGKFPFRYGKRNPTMKRRREPFRYGKRASLTTDIRPSAYEFLRQQLSSEDSYL